MNIEQTEALSADNMLQVLEQYRSPGMVQVNKYEKPMESSRAGSAAHDMLASGDVVMESHLGKNVNLWA